MKAYRVRKFQNGKNKDGKPFINYSLTIPSVIAEKLPQDMQFECELTDEGILFRPASEESVEVNLPSWAKSNGRTMADAQTKTEKRSSTKRGRPQKAEKAPDPDPAPA